MHFFTSSQCFWMVLTLQNLKLGGNLELSWYSCTILRYCSNRCIVWFFIQENCRPMLTESFPFNYMLKSKLSLSRHFEYANEQITYHFWLCVSWVRGHVYVLGVSILPLTTIFRFDFRTVPTVWHFILFVFHIIVELVESDTWIFRHHVTSDKIFMVPKYFC